MVRRGAKRPENQVRRFPPGRRGTTCITPLASPIHGGGGPRKRWKGLASGDNASYSFLHHSGGTPLVAGATTFAPIQGALWVLDILVNLRVEQQRKKNHTTGLRPWKCTPSAAFGGVSPGGGDFSGAIPCGACGVNAVLRFYSVPCIGESPAQPDKGGCGGPA